LGGSFFNKEKSCRLKRRPQIKTLLSFPSEAVEQAPMLKVRKLNPVIEPNIGRGYIMSTTKIKDLNQNTIYEASSSEIRAYGLAECGIEFEEHAARDTMINEIVSARGWMIKDREEGATHVEIIIAREPGVTGNFPYRGGANGEMFSIKRDEKVIIPMKFYEAIRSSQNRAGYTLKTLTDMGEISPDEQRIPKSGLPISIIRFITK
jgi:hypothetical protein